MALPSFDRKPYKVTLTEVSVRSTSQSSSGLSERGVRRKVDLRLLPLLFWLAIVASLDVQNIGSARIEGLPKTLHLAKQEFSVAVIVFYIPTILFTIPTNLLIHATRPSLFMGVMTLLCGKVEGGNLCSTLADTDLRHRHHLSGFDAEPTQPHRVPDTARALSDRHSGRVHLPDRRLLS